MDALRSGNNALLHRNDTHASSEASPRSSTSSVQTFRTALSEHEQQRLRDIRGLLTDIFTAHKLTGGDGEDIDHEKIRAQHDKIDRLIESRTEKLFAAGQTTNDIRRVLEKASFLDQASIAACSVANGLPFAATLIVQYLKPEVLAMFGSSAAGQWAGSAVQACVADRFMAPTLENLTADSQYLKPPTDNLHTSMQDSLKEKEPSPLQSSLEEGALWQSYLPRNVLRMEVVPAVASVNPQLAATLDGLGTPITGVIAGMLTAFARMQIQEGRDLLGPALLFGRMDTEEKDEFEEEEWLENYQAIDQASYSSHALQGLTRLLDMPKNFLADLVSGNNLKSLVDPASIYSSIALTGSFAAVGEAQAAALETAKANGAGPGIQELARLGTITTLSIPAFALYGMGYAGGKPGAEAADQWLRQDHKVAETSKAISSSISTSLNSTVNSLRQRPNAQRDGEDVEMQNH